MNRMPTKTKREKLLSAARREQSRLKSAPQNTTISEETIIRKSFAEDLKKSIFIIAFILTLEILLYFASMSNYVSHFLRF